MNIQDWLLENLQPPPFSGYWGTRFLGAFSLLADAAMHGVTCALRAPWLLSGYCPDDALDFIGSDRLMPAYPIEDAATYRVRLHGAWGVWPWAGTESAIEEQLEAAGYTATDYTIDGLTGWSQTNITVAGGQEDPVGGDAAVVLTDTNDGGSVNHYISAVATGLTSGDVCDFEILLKAGTSNWVRIQTSHGPNAVYVDTENGDVGTEGAEVSVTVFPTHDPYWRRYRIRWIATAAYATIRIDIAEADNDILYTGDGTGTVYAYAPRIGAPRVQVYTAQDWPNQPPYPYWSQFWVVLPRGTHNIGAEHTWGGGLEWGDDAVWGSDASIAEAKTLRGIAMQWKPGHWRCREYYAGISGHLWGTGLKWGMTGLVWGGESTDIEVQP